MEAVGSVLAICEGPDASERVVGIVIPLVLLAGWVWFIAFLLKSGPRGLRWWLAGTFLIAGAVAPFIFLFPGGISDSDTDYLGRFVFGLIAGAGIGVVAWSFAPKLNASGARLIGAGVAGSILVPGFLVGSFILALSLTGGCIG